MRTVEVEEYGSSRNDFRHRVLLDDDGEWRIARRKSPASEFIALSHVSTTMLAYCVLADTLSLPNEQKSLFCSNIVLTLCSRTLPLRNDSSLH